MTGPDQGAAVAINAEWVLRQLPAISYFCENDGLYTMRWLNAGSGNDLGYDLQDFVDNRHYFAASAVHPDDLDVVDQFAERALASRRPVIARYRLVHVEGKVLPTLLTARAVRDALGRPHGFCGMILNLADVPALQGESRVLTDPGAPTDQPRAPVDAQPERLTPAWIDRHAPAVTYVIEPDEFHSLRYAGGQADHLLGYELADFLNNVKYRAALSVLPEDEAVADEAVELAAARPGEPVVYRHRLVHAQGHAVPVLIAARCVQANGRRLVAGLAMDISHCATLQGKSCVLRCQ